jgi:tetraacyldisaccharide 4'-kinase
MEHIRRRFNEIEASRKLLITTEKDAVRLINNPYFPEDLKECAYYLPVNVHFDPHNVDSFDDELEKLLYNATH